MKKKLTEKELRTRDARRDIGQELLQSVKDIKAGKTGRVTKVALSPVAKARLKIGATQTVFARLLGVSVRTLQEWEQGRRQPSGAAKTLLLIAETQPQALKKLIAA